MKRPKEVKRQKEVELLKIKKFSDLPRLTFEEVLKNQTELVRCINYLIKKNRTLIPEEQEGFMQLYYRATLGKGALVPPLTQLPGFGNATLDDIVFYHLSIPESRGIRAGWADTDEHMLVTPAQAWHLVLRRLTKDVFGAALQQAVSLSPEKPGGVIFGGLKGEEKD